MYTMNFKRLAKLQTQVEEGPFDMEQRHDALDSGAVENIRTKESAHAIEVWPIFFAFHN